MIYLVTNVCIINKSKNVSFGVPCLLRYSLDASSLISVAPAASESSFYIWQFSFHALLKSGLQNFERYLTSVSDKSKCPVF